MKQRPPKEVGSRTAPAPCRMSEAARQRIDREMSSGKDEFSPAYLFSATPTSLVLAIIHGLIDPVAIARETLASRGLDENGEWVGFEQAKQIHGVKS